MSNPIRVMLCDDSGTMRRLIRKAIESDPQIEVVAEAKDGQDCVNQLKTARPEAIILDVEMPVMDGIDTTKAIRRINKTLPIIMFSSLTSKGAEATFDAMQAGANSFATKPESIGHVEGAFRQVKSSLIPLIISLARKPKFVRRAGIIASTPKKVTKTQSVVAKTTTESSGEVQRRSAIGTPLTPPSKIDIVAIGVSTGGPDALEKVLTDLPRGFSIPIVITQHMPALFTKMLAQRLADKTGHNVCEAEDGQVVRASQILIAPGDYHLKFQRNATTVITELTQEPPENSCRPAVDPMFRSIASLYGQRALGIVLTGMGQDGTNGAKAMKQAGAAIYVQDEATSVVWGMPRKVHESGFADRVLPISEIGPTIARCGLRAAQPVARTMTEVGSN